MQTNSTTVPMLADVDWPRFRREAEALAAELQQQHPHLTAREAGECAAAEVQRRYEVELAAQAELAQAAAQAKRAASVARAAAKAEYYLASGVQVRRSAGGAYLVPSSKGNAVIYVVGADFASCTCKAGDSGTPCWHIEAARQTAQAQPEPTPPATPAVIPFDAGRVLDKVRARRAALAA